jgi:histidinol-phosphate aminotransferase
MSTLIRQSVRAMTGYVPGEQPRQSGLIKLNTNENPYPPSPLVSEALARLDARDLRRYPDPVSLELRETIARLHGVKLEQVFTGNGSDEILALCTRAFVEDDGRIGHFEPSYSLYPVLAAIRNVGTAPVALGADFQWPDQEPREGALFFLANPNAPTSVLYPQRTVSRFCRRFGGVVLIDEAYVDFARADAMELAGREPNVLVMRTLSKSYSLAGLRLGYAIGPALLIEALFKIKDSYNLDRVTQAVATAAVVDQEHMRANVARIQATRARLAAALAALGFAVAPSETNFLWVKPPRLGAAELFAALKRRRVLVRHFAGLRTGAFLRITVGTDAEVDLLLEVLGALLNAKGRDA